MTTLDLRSDPAQGADLEALYLEVRRAEGRILSSEAIRKLPWVPAGEPHADEWRIRAATTDRLIRHLRGRTPQPHILDLGCGPGWMTAKMTRDLDATAIGIDCNRSELERGAQAFASIEGLELVYGDIFEPVVEERSFDSVVVAAALQYFPNPRALLNRLLGLVKPGGEILIADTPLYRVGEIEAATERSLRYYTSLGFPQMAEHYHHHATDDLAPFSPVTLYDPKSLLSRLGRNVLHRPFSPFPILAISQGGRP